MINNKRKILIIVSMVLVIISVVGVTYAFYNYNRTGATNMASVGKIYFNSAQDGRINLANVFPVKRTELDDNPENIDEVVINVLGDTTYTEGIEYLVSIYNVHNTVGNKVLPIGIDVSIEANSDVAGSVIGTEDDSYFTNRGGNTSRYKVVSKGNVKENTQLVVGYIAPGQTGVNGNITITAYIDGDKIAISDTYDGTESDNMGTTNNWVDEREVFTYSEWNNLNTDGISFQIRVEANEGIWVEEELTALEKIKENVNTTTIINFANISSDINGKGVYILPGTESDVNPIYYYRGEIDNNNVIFGDFCWHMLRTTDTGGIKMIYNGETTGTSEEPTCENTVDEDRVISYSVFNSDKQSISDVGYMSNTRYNISGGVKNGAIYGKNVEWDGNNYLVIEDTANTPSSNTTMNNYHHYSCGTAGTTSCSSVRYYFYDGYYITLTNGDKVEDALYKMTGNGDASTKARNASYVLNQNDSIAKSTIESWFRTNLTNEVDNTKRNYASYLEDTVYCNDRSFKTGSLEQSGWNPNGGDISTGVALKFGSANRAFNTWYSTTNVPSFDCPNETDRFSVSSSVAHLNYPVGLITADEIIMAGAAGNSSTINTSYYLYTGDFYNSLSPHIYDAMGSSLEFGVDYNGYLRSNSVENSFGLRPVVSLKPGIEFDGDGNGTPTNPYIVKYN